MIYTHVMHLRTCIINVLFIPASSRPPPSPAKQSCLHPGNLTNRYLHGYKHGALEESSYFQKIWIVWRDNMAIGYMVEFHDTLKFEGDHFLNISKSYLQIDNVGIHRGSYVVRFLMALD